jgi:hypothetical protein
MMLYEIIYYVIISPIYWFKLILFNLTLSNVEPFAYYAWLLKELPYAETVEDFENLLPWNFKKSDSDQ